MKEVFYTSEQKSILQKIKSENANKIPVVQSTGIMILDVLGEQQNTLQNIESILQRIEKLILSERQTQ